MLKVQNLEFYYKKGVDVLKDISFETKKGDILCLLGPNGTGKTTLLRCLLGLQQPKNGSIMWDGQELSGLSARERSKVMAYVPQSSNLGFSYSVREVVLMGRLSRLSLGADYSAHDKDICMESLQHLHIEHLAQRPYHELSGGERQMVLVARALAQQSSLLVMDEPTASLDYSNQVRILKVIRALSQQGYTILMTSHFPDHAFLACSVAGLMRDGKMLAFGPANEVVTSESLTELYRTRVCVTQAQTESGPLKVCIPLME